MPVPVLMLLLALGGYLAAGWLAWREVRAGDQAVLLHSAAGLAIAGHLVVLVHAVVHSQALVIGVGGALSLFAWQAALLLWLFNLRQPITALGVLVYPVAALCVAAGLLLPDANRVSAELDWPIQLHILLSLLAYGLLTLGAVQAGVLAWQHRRLHDRRPGDVGLSLPPLQTMEKLLFQLLAAGFFLLSLAIVSGGLFVDNLFAQHLAHKTLLSIAAWLILAVLLWGRWRYGWRGRVAVRWTLAAYAVLILAYFGSKLVLELILGEHWT